MKREDVVPGRVIVVKQRHVLILNAHRFAFGDDRTIIAGINLTIVTLPRKVEGINLVRVRMNGDEYETFYCDILKHCDV